MAASNWGLIMNIVNSIVGVSVLTMPFCFKQCGMLMGTLLLMLCSWMTHQSCMFLVKSASVSKRRTYAGLAFHAYGKAGKMLVETSMIGLMLGTCIAFYVVIGDLGSSFFARLLGLQVSEGFRVFLLFAVSLCIVLPLSLQRNMMASIQSFSAMALIFYTVFMFVIVLSSFKHGLFSGQWMNHVSYARWEGIFRCIPIFGMSFACQSQVLPTYDSLDEPSVKIMSSIFASSLNVVTTFYVTVGFFSYVSFTEAIAGNVLVNFPSNLVTEMIRVGFMMSVAVGFPMMILPCRQALNTLLFEQQQKDGTFTAGGYMPPLRFKVLTLTVVFGTMLGGILIPNVETILGVTGATMGSLICFICPALIYKKIHNKGLSSQFILAVGLVILVISTYTTMTVTEESPIQTKSDLLERKDIINEGIIEQEQILPKISANIPKLEEPDDDRDKPKLPVKKPELEQPQIKGPIDVPQQEEGKRKKEEDQLDRPEQGIAVPVGEAHRHEPPVPRDDLAVEDREEHEESIEKKLPLGGGDDALIKGEDIKKEDIESKQNEQLPPKKEENEQVPQQPPQEEDVINGAKENLPVKDQQKEQLNKEIEPAGKNEDAAVEPIKNLRGGEEKALNDLSQLEKALENQLIEEGKKDPAAVEPEEREVHNAEQKPGDNQEEAEKAEILDHAILLQVIKEQQVQQKRLLDQQEKLLAVIKEQHMEIHQQKEGEEQQDKPDGQAPELSKSKEDEKAEVVEGKQEIKQEPVEDTEKKVEIIEKKSNSDLHKEPKQEKEQNVPMDKVLKLPEPEDQGIKEQPVAQKVKPDTPQNAVPDMKQALEVQKQPDVNPVIQNLVQEDKGALKNQDQDKALLKKDDIKHGAVDKSKESGVLLDLKDKAKAHEQAADHKLTVGAVIQHLDKADQVEKKDFQKGQAASQVNVEESHKQVVELNQQAAHKNDDPVEVQNFANDNKIIAKEDIKQVQIVEEQQEQDQGKPKRDLKLQNDLDLRRRKREIGMQEGQENEGAQMISLHPVPNLKVNDLRGALETRINQAAEGGLHVVHGRQIKQLLDDKKKR
ncbi:solute carrier family 38 member 10 isoform 2-T2 [Pelodytes ibericus]